MASFLRWYARVLQTNPLKTQFLTTGFIMASGDIAAQTLIEKRYLKQIEPVRVMRFAILGSCFVGPVLCVWYLRLDKIFGMSGRTTGLKKMLVDQFMFAPCFIGSIITVSGGLQLQTWNAIREKINQNYLEILKTNYKLWPAAQLVTFYLIPTNYRVIFVSFVSLIWNTYLTSKVN